MKSFLLSLFLLAFASGCALPGATRAREVQELHQVRTITIACQMYAADHGTFPNKLEDLRPFIEMDDSDWENYELVTKGVKPSEVTDSANTVLVRSKTVSRRGNRAVAHVDGSAMLVPVEE